MTHGGFFGGVMFGVNVLMLTKKSCDIRVVSKAEEITEGLFGHVFLCVIEILPYL
jgi:hypothetical protein